MDGRQKALFCELFCSFTDVVCLLQHITVLLPSHVLELRVKVLLALPLKL